MSSSSEQQSQHNDNNIRTSQAQIWVVHDKETGQLMTNKPTSSPSSKWSWPPVATTSPTTHKPTPHFFIYYPIGPQPTTPPPSPPPTTLSPSPPPSILPSKSPTSLPSKSPITPLPSSSSPSNSPISSSLQPTTERPTTSTTTTTTNHPSKSPSYKPIYIPSPTPPPSLTPPLTTSSSPIPIPINNKVTGHIFYDTNSNGSFDYNITGDVHISNINIWLFTCGGSFSDIVSNTKTSSGGTFVFDELRVGTYLGKFFFGRVSIMHYELCIFFVV